MALSSKIALSTKTWDVVPDAKIHFSVYMETRSPLEGAAEEGVLGGQSAVCEEQVLVSQGFYTGAFELALPGGGEGGLLSGGGERKFRVKAITMHPSMVRLVERGQGIRLRLRV